MRTLFVLTIVVALVVGGVAPVAAAPEPSNLASHGEPADEAAVECEFPFASPDATGTEVTVDDEPETIVTLNPSAAQTMWEIGGREKVVGLTEYAEYLEGAESRTDVSAGSGDAFVNVERVIELDPDLVLAPNTIPNETVGQLRDAGLTVFKFGFQQSIADIEQKTLLTGQLTGECEGAEETVGWMRSELDRVDRAVEGRERPRVLYVFFGYTGGDDTFAHRVIERAGGRNIAAEANITGYQPINEEVVVDRDPEWILVNDNDPGVPASDAYNGTTAVQQDQIVEIRVEHINQPAPRIVLGIVTLAEAIHSDAFETPEGTPTNPDPGGDGHSPTPTPTPTTTDGQPGFGAAAALVGLLGGALLLRRQ